MPRNYLADVNFLNAIKEAKRADEERRVSPEALPALHGIPVTIKDNIFHEGQVSTFGLMKRCNMKDPVSSPTVLLLKEQGAIIISKTNMS